MEGKTLGEVIHKTAKDFHEAGVMSEQTLRDFDAMCLSPVKKIHAQSNKVHSQTF
ncbi:MAG: DNA-binding protein [Coxiellaceae bacterium]|nr:DNA-binding protein [Coxiellaceae bacterium]